MAGSQQLDYCSDLCKFAGNEREKYCFKTLGVRLQKIISLHYLYTFNGEKHILDFDSMEEIEDVLDPKQFYRAIRQTLLNIAATQSMKPHENQKLTVNLKPPLKLEVDISREKAPQFKKWFDR